MLFLPLLTFISFNIASTSSYSCPPDQGHLQSIIMYIRRSVAVLGWIGFFFLTKERELKMPQRSCFVLKGHRITAKLPGVF